MKNLFVNMINIQPGVTIGILLLVICRPFLKKNYRAKLCYMLWLVVALRLALPFDITLPQKAPSITIPVENYYITPSHTDNAPVGFELTPAAEYESRPQAPVTSTTPTQNVIEMATRPAISLLDIAVAVWTAVAVGLLSTSAVAYLLSKRELLQGAVYDKELTAFLADIAKQLKVTQQVKVCTAHYTGSPMLIGIMEPVIIIPQADYTDSDLAMILCHELTHLKRFDIGYKLLLHILKCAYWFNPLVWLMAKYAQEDIELSCDEDITANRNKDFKARYATAILQVVARNEGTPVLSTAFSQNAKSVKERFSNIFFGAVKKKGKNVLAVFMVLVIVATTVVGCGSENKIIEQDESNVRLIELTSIETINDKIYMSRRNPYDYFAFGDLLVSDLVNGTTQYMCTDTECSHSDVECTACDPANYNYIYQLTDGTLLMYSYSPANGKWIDNIAVFPALYILNPDDYSKQLLHVFNDSEHKYMTNAVIAQVGDCIYVILSGEVADKSYTILQINYKTGENRLLAGTDCPQIISADKDNLYLGKSYYFEENGTYYGKYTVVQHSISDGTTTEIYSLTKTQEEEAFHKIILDGKVYFSYVENDNLNISYFDPLTKSDVLCVENESCRDSRTTMPIYAFGDIMIYYSYTNNSPDIKFQPRYVNIKTGQKGRLSLKETDNYHWLFPIAQYGDYYVVWYGGKEMEHIVSDVGYNKVTEKYIRETLSLISIEDYLNGNPDFIPIDDIV